MIICQSIPLLAKFRKGFGCQSNFVETSLRLAKGFRQSVSQTFLMDLSKAFFCPLGLLIAKLRAYGLSDGGSQTLGQLLRTD